MGWSDNLEILCSNAGCGDPIPLSEERTRRRMNRVLDWGILGLRYQCPECQRQKDVVRWFGTIHEMDRTPLSPRGWTFWVLFSGLYMSGVYRGAEIEGDPTHIAVLWVGGVLLLIGGARLNPYGMRKMVRSGGVPLEGFMPALATYFVVASLFLGFTTPEYWLVPIGCALRGLHEYSKCHAG